MSPQTVRVVDRRDKRKAPLTSDRVLPSAARVNSLRQELYNVAKSAMLRNARTPEVVPAARYGELTVT